MGFGTHVHNQVLVIVCVYDNIYHVMELFCIFL